MLSLGHKVSAQCAHKQPLVPDAPDHPISLLLVPELSAARAPDRAAPVRHWRSSAARGRCDRPARHQIDLDRHRSPGHLSNDVTAARSSRGLRDLTPALKFVASREHARRTPQHHVCTRARAAQRFARRPARFRRESLARMTRSEPTGPVG